MLNLVSIAITVIRAGHGDMDVKSRKKRRNRISSAEREGKEKGSCTVRLGDVAWRVVTVTMNGATFFFLSLSLSSSSSPPQDRSVMEGYTCHSGDGPRRGKNWGN